MRQIIGARGRPNMGLHPGPILCSWMGPREIVKKLENYIIRKSLQMNNFGTTTHIDDNK